MLISFKQRVQKYLLWRVKKSRRSHRLMSGLVVVVLCLGMYVIASFYQPVIDRYDTKPYEYYPITLECDIQEVLDGDTIIANCPKSLKNDEKSLRSIRFWGIDAPETGQGKWGSFATETLENLIGDRQSITIEIMNQDRYQRMIGKLYISELDVSLEMVRLGAAVVYHRYNKDQNYINAEKKARMTRLGVWAVAGAQQNPERWRRFNP